VNVSRNAIETKLKGADGNGFFQNGSRRDFHRFRNGGVRIGDEQRWCRSSMKTGIRTLRNIADKADIIKET